MTKKTKDIKYEDYDAYSVIPKVQKKSGDITKIPFRGKDEDYLVFKAKWRDFITDNPFWSMESNTKIEFGEFDGKIQPFNISWVRLYPDKKNAPDLFWEASLADTLYKKTKKRIWDKATKQYKVIEIIDKHVSAKLETQCIGRILGRKGYTLDNNEIVSAEDMEEYTDYENGSKLTTAQDKGMLKDLLETSETAQELKNNWNKVPTEFKKGLEATKDKMKKKLGVK